MNKYQLMGLDSSHIVSFKNGEHTALIHKDLPHLLRKLIQHAKQDGFDLTIASGFRDFHRQAWIWNRKFTGVTPILDTNSTPLPTSSLSDLDKIMAILRWSALPSASRHHWGTDLDIYAKNHLPANTQIQLEPWEYEQAHQKAFYCWMQENLPEYGFSFPYMKDLGGVAKEPWHISYAPIANYLLQQLDLSMIEEALQHNNICGSDVIIKQLDKLAKQFIYNVSA